MPQRRDGENGGQFRRRSGQDYPPRSSADDNDWIDAPLSSVCADESISRADQSRRPLSPGTMYPLHPRETRRPQHIQQQYRHGGDLARTGYDGNRAAAYQLAQQLDQMELEANDRRESINERRRSGTSEAARTAGHPGDDHPEREEERVRAAHTPERQHAEQRRRLSRGFTPGDEARQYPEPAIGADGGDEPRSPPSPRIRRITRYRYPAKEEAGPSRTPRVTQGHYPDAPRDEETSRGGHVRQENDRGNFGGESSSSGVWEWEIGEPRKDTPKYPYRRGNKRYSGRRRSGGA